MMAAFNQIIKTYQGKSIGIINHGDPIRALWFQLIHSHKKYPTYSELIKMVGLGTMEGMRLQINSEGKPDSSIEIIQGI